MRLINLNSTFYKLADGTTIDQRAVNPWKAQIKSSGGAEYSDFSQAELEEYYDFRNGIGLDRGVGSEARLQWTEGIDFAIKGQAVLGPLVTSTTPPAISAPTIVNADMELNANWTDGVGTAERSNIYARSLTYSWQLDASVGDYVYQDLTGYKPGAEYTFTCYATANGAQADGFRVAINDGVTTTNGTVVSVAGDGVFAQATVTMTLATNATRLRVILETRTAVRNIYFDDAAISVTALSAFSGVKILDFGGATYAVGTAAVYKWSGSAWAIVIVFANAIDCLVVTDATDEYLVISNATNSIYSVDGAAWVDLQSWKTPDSSTDADSEWTNDANAFDGSLTTYASVSAADKYLQLVLTTPVSTDKCRIYCSDGAAGNANANVDFYYDGAWHDVYDGTITGNTWTTITNAAGIKEVEQARVESSDGASFRFKDFDFLGYFHGHVASFANRLWGIHTDGSHLHYSAVGDIDTYSSGFSITGNFGTVYGLFEGKLLSDGSATLYFHGTEGLYSVDTTNEKAYEQEVAYPPLTYSGKSGLYWNANVWLATGYGILKVSSSTAAYVGPDQDDGLPSGYQGHIYDMTTVNNWLVYCVNGGSTDKSSIMKRSSSLGGNLQVYTGAANKPIPCLHHSPSSLYTNGRLWFAESTNIKYMMFPDTTSNTKQISTYTYVDDSGYGYLPIFRKLANISKTALGVSAITKSCNANEYIELWYDLNGAGSWVDMGDFNTSPRDTILTFGSGLGAEFYTIQFRIKLIRGNTVTNSPELESLMFYYLPVPARISGWVFTIDATGEDGEETFTAFETLLDTNTLVVFYPSGDIDKTSYNVKLTKMPSREWWEEQGRREGFFTCSVEEIFKG